MHLLINKLKKQLKVALGKVGLEIHRNTINDDMIYRQLYSSESLENRKFYTVSVGGHLGFGCDFEHPFWTNVDLNRPIPSSYRQFNSKIDVCHDLLDMKKLPIENDSAEIILSQYAVEHVPDNAAAFFFKDAHRALKVNGILKIVTPNTELDVLAYHNRDRSYFHWNNWKSQEGVYQKLGYKTPLSNASFEQSFIAHFAANASALHAGGNPNKIGDDEVRDVIASMETQEALDYFTSKCCPKIQRKYRENHISWWSPEKLKRELRQAGFKRVNILAPCQSNSPVLRNRAYFDRLWNDVATFVEAVK